MPAASSAVEDAGEASLSETLPETIPATQPDPPVEEILGRPSDEQLEADLTVMMEQIVLADEPAMEVERSQNELAVEPENQLGLEVPKNEQPVETESQHVLEVPKTEQPVEPENQLGLEVPKNEQPVEPENQLGLEDPKKELPVDPQLPDNQLGLEEPALPAPTPQQTQNTPSSEDVKAALSRASTLDLALVQGISSPSPATTPKPAEPKPAEQQVPVPGPSDGHTSVVMNLGGILQNVLVPMSREAALAAGLTLTDASPLPAAPRAATPQQTPPADVQMGDEEPSVDADLAAAKALKNAYMRFYRSVTSTSHRTAFKLGLALRQVLPARDLQALRRDQGVGTLVCLVVCVRRPEARKRPMANGGSSLRSFARPRRIGRVQACWQA